MPLPQQMEHLLLLATDWVAQQEEYILQHGRELTPDEQIDAHLVGVQFPAKVRILEVDQMPTPDLPELKAAAIEFGLATGNARGVCFRYGICVEKGTTGLRRLLAHELTHAMQYERFRGIKPFLTQYIDECITVGYLNAPLEQEARAMEKKILES